MRGDGRQRRPSLTRPWVAFALLVPSGAGRRSLSPPQNSRGSGYGMATSMLAGELVWFRMERASSGAR